MVSLQVLNFSSSWRLKGTKRIFFLFFCIRTRSALETLCRYAKVKKVSRSGLLCCCSGKLQNNEWNKVFCVLSKEWNSLFCLNFIWSRSGRRDGSERMIIVIKTRYAKGSGCSIVMNIICAFRVRLLPDMNFQVLYCSSQRNCFLLCCSS